MKTIASLISSLTVLMILVVSAFAFVPNTVSSNGLKNPDMFATPSYSSCLSIVSGRATSVTVPVSSYLYLRWQTDNGSGTPVAVKRSFNTNTAYFPTSGEQKLGCGSQTNTVTFTRYSGSAAVNLCYDAQ